jgi:hypothetical protein
MPEYKYKEAFESLQCNCPPINVSTFETVAYRFSFRDVNDLDSWLPIIIGDEDRFASDSDESKCGKYGLSFFTKKDKAIKRYSRLAQSNPNFKDRVGEYLSIGYLCKCDGTCGEVNKKNSHFNLFEFENVSF